MFDSLADDVLGAESDDEDGGYQRSDSDEGGPIKLKSKKKKDKAGAGLSVSFDCKLVGLLFCHIVETLLNVGYSITLMGYAYL